MKGPERGVWERDAAWGKGRPNTGSEEDKRE